MFAHLDDPDAPTYDSDIDKEVRTRAGSIRRRRRSVRTAGGLVCVAAAIAGVLVSTRGAGTVEVTTAPPTPRQFRLPRVTEIDGSTVAAGSTPTYALRKTDFVVMASLPANTDVATVGGEIFAVSAGARIERLDPTSGRTVASTSLSAVTSPLVEGAGHLWVGAGHSVVELDPRTLRRVGATVTSPGRVTSVAVAGGQLWFVSVTGARRRQSGVLYRQPLTGGELRTAPLPYGVDTVNPSRLVTGVVANSTGTALAATLSGNEFVVLNPPTGVLEARYQVVEANSVTISGIAGNVAWYIGGVGHNNVLGAVNLRTSKAVSIVGTPRTLPGGSVPAGGGGSFDLTGTTVLETFNGRGPDACINPATGRARSYFLLPVTVNPVGVAGKQLLARAFEADGAQKLLRSPLTHCA